MALDKAHNCWTGPMGPDGAGLEPKLKKKKNPFIKRAGFRFRGWAHESGLDIKKSDLNQTRCHSYTIRQ